jgi:hypothetical protein
VKLVLAAVASLICVTAAAAALADDAAPSSRVALLLPACDTPGLSQSELRSALALDLSDEGLALAPIGEVSPDDVLVRLETTCTTTAELTLRVARGNDTRTRQIDLSELPPAQRARALSLSLAELLSQLAQSRKPSADSNEAAGAPEPASAATPTPTPTPTPEPPPPKPPSPAPPPTAKPAPKTPRMSAADSATADTEPADQSPGKAHARWQLTLAPELRFFQTTSLWGARALANYGAWSAGVDLLTARQSAPPGTVSIFVVHASCAYHLRLFGEAEGSRLEAGPRLGAGRTFLSAQANATGHADSAQDVYLDIAFGARYSFRLSSALRVGLGAELGFARGPIGYADNLEIARTAGGFASLMIDGAVQL